MTIEELKAENLILRKLPVRLEEKLQKIVPDIAEALQKQVFKSNLDKIQKANEAIDDMIKQFDQKIAIGIQACYNTSNLASLHKNFLQYYSYVPI